jgi:hypothetical protein
MALGVRRLNHLNLSDGELQFRGNFLSVTLNHRSIVAQSRRAVSQGGKLSYRDTKEFSGQYVSDGIETTSRSGMLRPLRW